MSAFSFDPTSQASYRLHNQLAQQIVALEYNHRRPLRLTSEMLGKAVETLLRGLNLWGYHPLALTRMVDDGFEIPPLSFKGFDHDLDLEALINMGLQNPAYPTQSKAEYYLYPECVVVDRGYFDDGRDLHIFVTPTKGVISSLDRMLVQIGGDHRLEAKQRAAMLGKRFGDACSGLDDGTLDFSIGPLAARIVSEEGFEPPEYGPDLDDDLATWFAPEYPKLSLPRALRFAIGESPSQIADDKLSDHDAHNYLTVAPQISPEDWPTDGDPRKIFAALYTTYGHMSDEMDRMVRQYAPKGIRPLTKAISTWLQPAFPHVDMFQAIKLTMGESPSTVSEGVLTDEQGLDWLMRHPDLSAKGYLAWIRSGRNDRVLYAVLRMSPNNKDHDRADVIAEANLGTIEKSAVSRWLSPSYPKVDVVRASRIVLGETPVAVSGGQLTRAEAHEWLSEGANQSPLYWLADRLPEVARNVRDMAVVRWLMDIQRRGAWGQLTRTRRNYGPAGQVITYRYIDKLDEIMVGDLARGPATSVEDAFASSTERNSTSQKNLNLQDHRHLADPPAKWVLPPEITVLTTPSQLAWEGEQMGHCVGGYVDAVERGSAVILSIQVGDHHSTAEVSRQGIVRQHFGARNSLPAKQNKDFLEAVMRNNGWAWGTGAAR